MRRTMKKFCMTFDILLALNFVGVLAATFAAGISDGDAKLTVIMGALNTLIIILTRISSYNHKRKELRYERSL